MPLIRVLLLSAAALLLAAGAAHAGPQVTAAPSIAGEALVGARLTAVGTGLAEAAPEDLAIDWERSDGAGFTAIPEAHGPVYVPVAADVGHRLRVRVAVETADGADEAWSEPTAAVGYRVDPVAGTARIGPEPGAPARLSRWRVTAGDAVRLSGRLAAASASATARLLLVPTIPTYATVEVPVAIAADGTVEAAAVPAVNAVAWLEVAPTDEEPLRIRLGLVGVRPRLAVVLGAQPDGRDATGRPLVRDLRLLPGSVLAPALPGLRLTWEGRLPGERTGTAVCRSTERVVSGADGRLRGGCRTRGSWRAARWRLVLDPGTLDPTAAPFLPAASAWVVPRLGAALAQPVPDLLRSSATLRPWS